VAKIELCTIKVVHYMDDGAGLLLNISYTVTCNDKLSVTMLYSLYKFFNGLDLRNKMKHVLAV